MAIQNHAWPQRRPTTMPVKLAAALTLLTAMLIATPLAAQTRLLRFPDLHGDRVVFTYAGDLWIAAIGDTGTTTARRLTTHPGLELFAKFSPDGEWIAFTGQYDGDEQVYIVPTAGGEPRQLTFYPALGPLPARWGYDHQVYGWTTDGSAVLFRSMRDGWDLSDTQLFTIPIAGGLPEALPMPESGGGAFSPDGARVVYSPTTRDFRHWKRYKGGWAQDLYIFDLETWDSRRITEDPHSDRDPMWIGDKIYFSSDRDGKLNLYSFDPASGALSQLTHSKEWDLRWPSAGNENSIIYEKNGELEVFELASGATRRLSIAVPTDALAARPRRVKVGALIDGFSLAPKGRRAVFAARGEILSAPIENGPVRNLTRSSGAHDREPAWSPDGRFIAFVSDLSGEEEIYRVDQAGTSAPERLTDLAEKGYLGLFYKLLFSPDSERLAFTDQRGKLLILEIESRALTEIADDSQPFGVSYSWSPRGGHLAFNLSDENGFSSLWIWSVADGESRRVTGELWNEYSPSFDPEGKYLFYLSDRAFPPQIGSYEFNYVVDRETQVYALALRQDVEHPYPIESDEVEIGADGAGESDGSAGKGNGRDDEDDRESDEAEKEDEGPVVIEFEGLAQRVARVPVAADNYFAVAAVPGHLLLVKGGASYYGRESDRQPALEVFTHESRESQVLQAGLQGLVVSPDGSKVLVRNGGSFRLLEAKPGGGDAKNVSTAGLEMDLVPKEEWAQIYDEVWRRFRDFFYVPNMHGYDWKELGERFRPLLSHVGHRSDLTYVMTELIAELEVSHAYVAGGDMEVPDRPRAALLGARFGFDSEAGRYFLAEILAGQNEEEEYRSPLTEIGRGVNEGDFVLAINGSELAAGDNPFRLLRHAGGAPVELTVNSEPSLAGSRRVTIDPISNEDNLLYLAWIEHNRRYVAERTDDRVGYIHIPDMGAEGIREWVKWFYGQIRKEGLVIDVRSNGGGNVSPMIIERLRRDLLMVDFERNVDDPDPYPRTLFHGHLVCVMDEDTASDGDQFAYVFSQTGLGPLVGKRSWGGVVGIYGRGPLIDGGSVSVPEAGSADAAGNWVVEGWGVEPDHVVEQDPKAVLQGRDPQLDKAIELVYDKVRTEPKRFPQRPAGPIKPE